MSEPTYSLDDLAERSGTPSRTIRYYIQRGLVDRPCGEKRGAYYTGAHLRQLLQIRQWVGAGMSLQRIAALLQEDAGDALADRLPPPAAQPLPAWARIVDTAHTPTAAGPDIRHHYTLAPGIELVIDAARSALTPDQVTRLRALLGAHLANLPPKD